MKTEREKDLDELLKKVVPKMNDELIEEWEKDVDYNHKFSSDFKKKMKKAVSEKKKESKAKSKKNSNIWGKIAAIILIGVIFSFGSGMIAKANPQLFFGKEEYPDEDLVQYHYDTDSDSDEYSFTPYKLVYIPKGYVETNREETEFYVNLTYTNEEGEWFIWKQKVVIDGGTLVLDTEYDDYELLKYAGEEIHVYKYDDGSKNVYYESGNTMFIIYATNLSTDDIYKMIKEME